MSDSHAPQVALLVEAEADARAATRLIDGQLRAAADWLRDAELDHYRSWQVVHWKSVPKLCKQHGVVVHGGFEAGRKTPDARIARRALMLLSKQGRPDAVVLLRDADSQPERRTGLAQGRDDHRHDIDPARIAIGVASPCREAWHLAGFQPESPTEHTALERQRARLSLDPTREPQRLARQGERDIKKVLASLTGDDFERADRCLEAPEPHLRECGRDCGLPEFLDELRERVVPAITGRAPS